MLAKACAAPPAAMPETAGQQPSARPDRRPKLAHWGSKPAARAGPQRVCIQSVAPRFPPLFRPSDNHEDREAGADCERPYGEDVAPELLHTCAAALFFISGLF